MSASPEKLVRDEIRALAAYQVPPSKGLVKLDAMENPYCLPDNFRRELAETLSSAALNRYPDPEAPALKSRIREVMAIPNEFDLVLGNGSDELIGAIVQCLARPGASVLAPSPTFVMYSMYATFCGMRYVAVPLNPDFSLGVERFLAAIEKHKPAVVFLSYPNNPTGNLFPEGEVSELIGRSPGLVVLDEAYHVFAGKTFLTRLARHPNLVVLRTLSKLGLAGIRLGYAIGRPEWTREFDKIRGVYNVNVLTQIVAEKALSHYQLLEAQAEKVKSERGRVAGALRALPGVVPYPSDANFILARVPGCAGVFEGLKRDGVLVKNFPGHPVLDSFLRVTVGTPEENERFLASLSRALRSR